MSLDLNNIKLNKDKVGLCRFKKFGDKYLVTNDVGFYCFLAPGEFKKFLEGKLDPKSALYQKLKEKGFIKDELEMEKMTQRYSSRSNPVFLGPSLHIIVVTLRCNFKCVYCQASSRSMEDKGYDMDKDTARKVVDNIFKAPRKVITIEFQGGEPLVNWPVVKFIVEYAREKNREEKKKLFISLVSNLSLMTEDKYDFLRENKVSICTSLDGPKEVHNKNRPWKDGDSYDITTSWIKKIKEREKEKKSSGDPPYHLSALTTISRFSLDFPREIVEEYINLGFTGIHLRPLSFLGFAGEEGAKKRIGYSKQDFMAFWKEALDYIIEINKRGKFFFERGATIMLKKILTDKDPGFLDLRSPCGAGIGQMVYNYDGGVYTCDEGRMVKDDTFLLGNVKKDDYQALVSNRKVKTMTIASTLDNLPCDYCVYKPYCGVCPVLFYALYKNLFPQLRNTYQCKMHTQMLDYIFRRLQEEEVRRVFDAWVKKGKG